MNYFTVALRIFIICSRKFAARNNRLFKALLGKEDAMFSHPNYDYLLAFVEEALKKLASNEKRTGVQLEILTHYMASAFIGTLKWWVEKDMPCSVEEMEKYLKRFTMNGIGEVLGTEGIGTK